MLESASAAASWAFLLESLRVSMRAVMASLFEEIHASLLTNAVSPASAREIFEREWSGAIRALETSPGLRHMERALAAGGERLAANPVKRSLAETPTILLAGEIFVRHDDRWQCVVTQITAVTG